MTMYNPTPPRRILLKMSTWHLSMYHHGVLPIKLHVSPSTFHAYSIVKVLSAQKWPYVYLNVLVELPESWLTMQDNYNLWHAKEEIDLSQIEPLVAAPA